MINDIFTNRRLLIFLITRITINDHVLFIILLFISIFTTLWGSSANAGDALLWIVVGYILSKSSLNDDVREAYLLILF